jgi:RND family efflux transporter MFP subunit
MALAAAGAGGCDRSRQAEAAAASTPGGPAPVEATPTLPSAPAPRTIAAVGGRPIPRTLLLDSHLLVERDVAVTARRDGFVETIHVDRGQLVTEDDPLATLEHGDLLVSEKEAMLELEKEQASFERAARLHEQEIIPREEFEQARLRRDAAQKALERIRYEIGKCVIRAPFDGVVSGRFVEKGQVIKEDDGRPLFQVTALRPLLARVYLPEWALFGVREGHRVGLAPAAFFPAGGDPDGGGIEAKVRWINHVLDAASGSAEMLVEITGGPGAARLRPGMSVQVRIDLSYGAGAAGGGDIVSLPREAVGPSEPSPGQRIELQVLTKGGAIEARSVVLGFVGDERVEVRRGLSAGEKVVLGPAAPPPAAVP